jgi:hypothetical protein
VTAVLPNAEGIAAYDIRWRWADGGLARGFTAVVRVRNEALNLPFVLPPLFRSVPHVVVVDNDSTDGSADVARQVAAAQGATDRLEVFSYPFTLARYGTEHLDTRPDSVRSPTYFTNWAFSHVRTTYTLKWDGDMVLTGDGERIVRDLVRQVERQPTVVHVPRYALYVVSDDVAWVDVALTNREPWAWPNRDGMLAGKGFEWEIPLFGGNGYRPMRVPEGICFETKWLDRDEFAHWSHRDFGRTPRTARKRRELEVVERLSRNDPPSGLIRIARDAATAHVIETVARISRPEWSDLTSALITAS